MQFNPINALIGALAQQGLKYGGGKKCNYTFEETLKSTPEGYISAKKVNATFLRKVTPAELLEAAGKHGFSGRINGDVVEFDMQDVIRRAKELWAGTKNGFIFN